MSSISRPLLLLSLLFALLASRGGALQTPSGGAPDGPPLAVVPLEGELTRGSLSLVARALREARALDSALVLELDTPGGRVDLMRQLGVMLEEARTEHRTHVVAWVKNEAMSAGAFVALHCDAIAMRDGTRIGAATPIQIGPMGAAPVANKMVSALRAEFRAAAEKNGYPAAIAEAMVDGELEVHWVDVAGEPEPRAVTGEELDELRSLGRDVRSLGRIDTEGQPVALTAREAVEYRLAFEAESLDQVVESLIPRLYSSAPRVVRIEATAAEWLAQVLGSLAPILLILGIALIWIEFQMPGVGLPAAGAAICFGLLLAGRYIAGLAGLEHLVLIGGGLLLIALEIFVFPGTFWSGIGGGLMLLAGLVLSATGDIRPLAVELDRYLLLQAAFETAMWLLLAAVASAAINYFLPRTPFYARLSVGPTDVGETFGSALGSREESRPRDELVGRPGVATTALRPVGHVRLDGEGIVEFEAWALDGPLDAGTRVRVDSTDGGRLRVESQPASDLDASTGEGDSA